MTSHTFVTCPECFKKDKRTKRSNTMKSRDFIEHIKSEHDKKYHKWFQKWSKEFFKLNPEFQIYMGTINKDYIITENTRRQIQIPRKVEKWEYQ